MSFRRFLGLILPGAWLAVFLSSVPAFAAHPDPIAVMPFKNLNTDPQTDWLRAGIAETMISDLKKAGKITLVERDQIERALAEIALQKDEEVGASDAARVGKLVGAKTVVLGAYQQAGKQVRINARFVAVETGVVLDTAKVTGPMENIFALQDQIVARLLGRKDDDTPGKPVRPSRKSGPQTVEAYKLYAMSLTTATDANRVDYLKRSIAIDPDFTYAKDELDALEKRIAGYSRQAARIFDARERELRARFSDPELDDAQRGAAALAFMNHLSVERRIHTLLEEARRIRAMRLSPGAGGDPSEFASQWELHALERLHRVDAALQVGERHLQEFSGGMTYRAVESKMQSLGDAKRRELDLIESARRNLEEIHRERAELDPKENGAEFKRLSLDYRACMEATKAKDAGLQNEHCDAFFSRHAPDDSEMALQFVRIARYYVILGFDRIGDFESARTHAERFMEQDREYVRTNTAVQMLLDNWPTDSP